MSGKVTTRAVTVRLPLALFAHAEAEALRCGMSSRQFITEAAHASLAERLCRHGAAPVTAAPPAPDGEDDE